ncbi:hypothetical protein D3C73_1164340 [compost metagenome]
MPADRLANRGKYPPEIGRGELHEPAHLAHVRHIAQALQLTVRGPARQVIHERPGAETVDLECIPGQPVISAQADIAPVQIEVRQGPGFVTTAGRIVGLIAQAQPGFTADAIGAHVD